MTGLRNAKVAVQTSDKQQH